MVKLTKSELEKQFIYKEHEVSGPISIGKLVDEYGRDFNIDAIISCSEYGDDPDCAVLIVSEERYETDEEYNERIKTLKENKQKELDQKKIKRDQLKIDELALYEKLKQKYG